MERSPVRDKGMTSSKFLDILLSWSSSIFRWWYIAISNCGSNKGLDVWYKFRMTNGAPGDFWNEHFSADEMCEYSMP